MCGIIGFTFNNEELLLKGLGSIKHRGPDADNTYLDKYISLGHSLLSIRGEVAQSIQPIKEPISDWLLAFNGQIYNLDHLKSLLLKDFSHENLDTKILYELIKVYEWDFIDHIEGMYSIFLMNIQTEEIRLYRDSSGQKPLYYSFIDQNLFFSSEIKGLLSMGINKEIDFDCVSYFLHLGYLPGSKSIFKNINRLMPGEVLHFNKRKRMLHIEKIDFFKKSIDAFSFSDISEDLITLLDLHLQSKTKVSINLSGGMDSASLLWAAEKSNKNINALTTRFVDAPREYNEEVNLASKLCKNLGIQHEILDISKENFIDNYIEGYETLEEPNGNVAIPLYLITAKYHKQMNNTVVISGDGGDETWGGYKHHYESQKLDNRKFKFINKLKPQNFIKRKTYLDLSNFKERYIYYRSSLSSFSQNKMSLLKDYFHDEFKYLDDIDEFKKLSITQQMFCLERLTWLAEENFMRSDKIYMSQSIEVRAPLAFQVFRNNFSNKFKVNNLWSDNFSKYPLRASLNNKLMDEINWRKAKVGWKAPIQERWYDDDFRNLYMDILPNENSTNILWKDLRRLVEKSNNYPGKVINYYISLAILKNRYNLDI